MSDVLVKAEDVSKKFCRTLKRSLWYGIQDVVRDLAGHKGNQEKLRPEEFWSLCDVSFELKRGECLGLIGPNGAGKSTLLKMLNGLIKPDQGCITTHGRVGALIELGAGFNPILTGRENIYINGAILGYAKREIDQKLDAIIDFAEIEKFIDSPVQSYSSGMKVRLGFAIASQMEPDVLLIDEVLAVGDVGFRSKCYNVIYEMKKNAAVIFVSHNMQQQSRLCDKAIVLQSGKIISCENHVPNAISSYLNLFEHEENKINENGENHITDITLDTEYEEDHYVLNIYDDLRVSFIAFIEDDHQFLEVNISILSEANDVVAQFNSRFQEITIENLGGSAKFEALMPCINLNPGYYLLSVSINDYETGNILSWHHAAIRFEVKGGFYGGGSVQYQGEWSISGL